MLPPSLTLRLHTRSIAALYTIALLVGPAVAPPAVYAAAAESSKTYALPAADDALPGAGPVRRDDTFQRDWQAQRSGWAKRVAQDRGAIVFVGDGAFAGWATELASAFPGLKVASRSLAGDTTRGVLWRLQDDVLALDPAAVVLLVGGDDLDQGATPEIAAANLRLTVDKLQESKPKMPIVVCQVLPSSGQAKRSADATKALNASYLQAVMNRPMVTYLETWTLFADANGNAPSTDFADGLKPNAVAYQKLAAALRPIFSTVGLLKDEAEAFVPESGFVSLFNGRDLTGWGYRPIPADEIATAKRRDASSPRPPVRVFPPEAVQFDGAAVTPEGRYLAVNGKLVVTTPPEYRKIQQLWTQQEFGSDFVLKLEFRATPNADSGVYIRGPQLQVRDYLIAGPYKQLKNFRPLDWNELVVTAKGEVAECKVNGEVVEAAFKIPAKGPIGLEGDRGQVEYRRIRISATP